jgi:hypothetical protein
VEAKSEAVSILLAVDPGIRGSGTALFVDDQLISAGFVKNPAKVGAGPAECADMAHEIILWALCARGGIVNHPTEIVVEIPQIYQRSAGKTKGDPNHLLPLFGIQCALAMALRGYAKVTDYKPSEWKGSTRKPFNQSGEVEYVITKRVKARLSPEELTCVDWTRSVKHSWDVADAVGLALHHIGRLDRVRAYARE